MTNLELFFEDPTKPPYLAGQAWIDPCNSARTGRKFGTLYHLRRNIDHCFGDLSPESEVPAPWPGALCIMAGIDLLSILFAGEANNQRVAANHPQRWKYSNEGRFTEYVKRFFQESERQHADKLWMLRNTLMHCFGVNSRTQRTKFVLTADPSAPALLTRIPPQNQNLYSVDLCKLKTSFEKALETYRASLIPANPDLMANFDNKFADYGWMIVCPSPTNPNAITSATPSMLTVHSLGLSVTNQSLSTFSRAASGQQF